MKLKIIFKEILSMLNFLKHYAQGAVMSTTTYWLLGEEQGFCSA